MLKLVYGCLAFSLVAGAILIIAASGHDQSFSGPTKVMNDALAQGAQVLAADKHGAITQTGNGVVAGYQYPQHEGDSPDWKFKFDRFAAGPDNPYGAGAVDASAWCASSCPSSIVELRGDYMAHSKGSAKLAEGLNTLKLDPKELLALPTMNQAFVRVAIKGQAAGRLLWVLGTQGETISALNPTVVLTSFGGTRIIVGSDAGANGAIERFQRTGEKIRRAAAPVRREMLRNACISTDGAWLGAISKRIQRFAFRAAPGPAFGPAIASGTCTVDSSGITAVFTGTSGPILRVARFSAGGTKLWERALGAQHLLSPSGSPNIVSQAPDGTVTAVDAISGKTVLRRKLAWPPYVAEDGSVVTADRKGRPTWLVAGHTPAP